MGVFVSLRRTVGIAFALVLLIPLGSAVSDAQERDPKLAVKSLPRPERPRDPKQRSFDPHAVLVKFKPGTSAAAKDGAVKGRGARMAGAVSGTTYEKVTSAGSADDLLRAMRADSTVASVSLDYRRTMTAAPNDPGYVLGDQNYLNTVRLPQAWDQTKGSPDQIIAVVDSGVDALHQDLVGRTVAGYNAITNTPTAANANTDDNGHGTMVAGIAAANTNNGIGIAGAAWNARVMPVKVLDSTGNGFDSDVAEGITWAADRPDCEILIVDDSRRVHRTAGLALAS